MQSEFLHITIIGCLVLLFGSTYRKRPSHVVRAWRLGWGLILVHFAALLYVPAGTTAANILVTISLSALFGCGLMFLSVPPRERPQRERTLIPILGLAGVGLLAYTAMAVWNVSVAPAYCLAGAVITTAWVLYAIRLSDVSAAVRALLIFSIAFTNYWVGWTIWYRHFDQGLSALLTQIFLLVGVTYIGTVRRISGGTLTVSLALIAWACVFPTAVWLEHLHFGGRVHPEFWNIPKYFVAFGMVLMLLEEEIIAANAAARDLSFQASHDALTGLRNRATLEHDLRAAVDGAQGSSSRCALICFDLDRFKHINDTYGHGVGDICLRATGERLLRLTAGRCSSARIGGEEFGLVLAGISSAEEPEGLAREIQVALREPIRAENYSIEVAASIGIAIFPDDGTDPEALWRNADAAMYRAKKSGGNQVASMSPEILRSSADANEMERALRLALREGGLELWFQPIFQPEGQIHSVEALVRLRHPELGLVLPTRFIALAEERGLIVPLGNWVFQQVCVQLADWRSRNLPPVPIAMNISAIQITSANFAASVSDLLAEYSIDPSLVAMELTETAMLRNVTEAARQIDLLAASGISFSVDDFGVGYSSLGQLDKLEVDYLKIDRSFVDRMHDASETRSIVAAIISMAHSLGLRVVAEGIQSQRTFNELAEMGCDLFQGFFLGMPQTADDLERLMLSGLRQDREPVQLLRAS